MQFVKLGKGLTGRLLRKDGFACFQQPAEDVEVGFRCRAYEDAGDEGIGDDFVEIMGEAAAGEKGRELRCPVGGFCEDIFQADIVVPEDRIQAGHAVDSETNECVLLFGMKERALKVFFLPVVIKPL